MTWNLDPPPGFRGLDEHRPVSVFHRHLPHWRQAGATYFLTWRQADSIPQTKLAALSEFRKNWYARNQKPHSQRQHEEIWRETFRRVDGWLDQGMGSCRMSQRDATAVVSDSLHYFQGKRYELGCYVVMPNHVHLIVQPFDEDDESLSRLTHSWKRHTGIEINQMFGSSGVLWQQECYDRIIRDEEHLWRVIQYIGRNLAKAKLQDQQYRRWINPAWEAIGWNFDRD